MDLFDIKLRLGVSRSHSVEINRLFGMLTSFEYYPRSEAQLYRKSPFTDIFSTARKSFNYPVNLGTCNVHDRLQPCEVSNYHLFVISSSNNPKHCISQLNGHSACSGVSCRKMACRKMNEEVAYAHNTESGYKLHCRSCNQIVLSRFSPITSRKLKKSQTTRVNLIR